ncbi:MAG: lysylphosphatidylglycerol synthase transmembrane domain-containing protein [Marinifilaceae bacterium]
MHKLGKNIIKFLFFLVITVVLFSVVYRDQDWNTLYSALKNDVDYFWIWVSIGLGIASHIIRAIRWQMITASMNYPISLPNSFMGVMIGYFANMALPRMGEFTRCAVVNKYENVPYSNLLGTVVTERIIDLIILLGLTVVVVIAQFGKLIEFFNKNTMIKEKAEALLHSSWLLPVCVGAAVLCYVVYRYVLKDKLGNKINTFIAGLKEGLLSIARVPQKGLFIFYSLTIWFLYFMMMYLCFFSFNITSHLSPIVGLTVFVLSSYGMVAPVQGGIGAWHFMVIAALLLYIPNTAENESMARTFALLTHGTMTLLYIVLGVICLLALPLYNNRYVKQAKDTITVEQ